MKKFQSLFMILIMVLSVVPLVTANDREITVRAPGVDDLKVRYHNGNWQVYAASGFKTPHWHDVTSSYKSVWRSSGEETFLQSLAGKTYEQGFSTALTTVTDNLDSGSSITVNNRIYNRFQITAGNEQTLNVVREEAGVPTVTVPSAPTAAPPTQAPTPVRISQTPIPSWAPQVVRRDGQIVRDAKTFTGADGKQYALFLQNAKFDNQDQSNVYTIYRLDENGRPDPTFNPQGQAGTNTLFNGQIVSLGTNGEVYVIGENRATRHTNSLLTLRTDTAREAPPDAVIRGDAPPPAGGPGAPAPPGAPPAELTFEVMDSTTKFSDVQKGWKIGDKTVTDVVVLDSGEVRITFDNGESITQDRDGTVGTFVNAGQEVRRPSSPRPQPKPPAGDLQVEVQLQPQADPPPAETFVAVPADSNFRDLQGERVRVDGKEYTLERSSRLVGGGSDAVPRITLRADDGTSITLTRQEAIDKGITVVQQRRTRPVTDITSASIGEVILHNGKYYRVQDSAPADLPGMEDTNDVTLIPLDNNFQNSGELPLIINEVRLEGARFTGARHTPPPPNPYAEGTRIDSISEDAVYEIIKFQGVEYRIDGYNPDTIYGKSVRLVKVDANGEDIDGEEVVVTTVDALKSQNAEFTGKIGATPPPTVYGEDIPESSPEDIQFQEDIEATLRLEAGRTYQTKTNELAQLRDRKTESEGRLSSQQTDLQSIQSDLARARQALEAAKASGDDDEIKAAESLVGQLETRERTAQNVVASTRRQIDRLNSDIEDKKEEVTEVLEQNRKSISEIQSTFNDRRQSERDRYQRMIDNVKTQGGYEDKSEVVTQKRSALESAIIRIGISDKELGIDNVEELIALRDKGSGGDEEAIERFLEIMEEHPDIKNALTELVSAEDAISALNRRIKDLEEQRDTSISTLNEQQAKELADRRAFDRFGRRLAGEAGLDVPGAEVPRDDARVPGDASAPQRTLDLRRSEGKQGATTGVIVATKTQLDSALDYLSKWEDTRADIDREANRIEEMADGERKTRLSEANQKDYAEMEEKLQEIQKVLGTEVFNGLFKKDDKEEGFIVINEERLNTLTEQLSHSRGTLLPGLFFDTETNEFFQFAVEDGPSTIEGKGVKISSGIGSIQTQERPPKFTSFSTSNAGLAIDSDGTLKNAFTGQTLNGGDSIELINKESGEKHRGTVIANPSESGDGAALVTTEPGFTLFGILGEPQIMRFGGEADEKGIRSESDLADFDDFEKQVDDQRQRFENIDTDLGDALAQGDDDYNFNDLDDTTKTFLRQQQGEYNDQLKGIREKLERGKSKDVDLGGKSMWDLEDLELLNQDELDLIQQFIDPETGEFPENFKLSDLELDEDSPILAKLAQQDADEAERRADILTDRNTIVVRQGLEVLSAMQFLNQVYGTYGGLARASSLFIDDDDMFGIKEEVHQAFCDSVVFGDPDCRAQAFCEVSPDHLIGGQAVVIGGSPSNFHATAHIQGYVYPVVVEETVDETTGRRRFQTERLYQITYSLFLQPDEQDSYNIVFSGPDGVENRMFTTSKPIAAGGSAQRGRTNPFVRYSTKIYNRVCIELAKGVEDYTGGKHKQICAPIIEKTGIATPKVQNAGEKPKERGENPNF